MFVEYRTAAIVYKTPDEIVVRDDHGESFRHKVMRLMASSKDKGRGKDKDKNKRKATATDRVVQAGKREGFWSFLSTPDREAGETRTGNAVKGAKRGATEQARKEVPGGSWFFGKPQPTQPPPRKKKWYEGLF